MNFEREREDGAKKAYLLDKIELTTETFLFNRNHMKNCESSQYYISDFIENEIEKQYCKELLYDFVKFSVDENKFEQYEKSMLEMTDTLTLWGAFSEK